MKTHSYEADSGGNMLTENLQGVPPYRFSAGSADGAGIETPPVMFSGSPTPMEAAFWEYAEPYTGMQGMDMQKSSHGRAFIAGWEAAIKHIMERKNGIQP